MSHAAVHLEDDVWEGRVCSRPDARRSKPPRRYSPRFDKQRIPGGHAGMHRRGTRG